MLFYLFFPGSGIGRYTHELLRNMQSEPGVEAELACLPSYHWRGEATYRVWPGLREIGHRWAWRRRMRFVEGQVVNPLRLARHVRETGADVVHLCNINHLTFPIWRRALDRTGVRIVATAHDVRRQQAMVNRRYEDGQLRAFYRRADALFVHSRSQAQDLVEFAGVAAERIHQVAFGPFDYGRPRGSRIELRKRLGWPADKQVGLFFGNIRNDKNLDLLIEALPGHAERVHLAVVGRGSGGRHRGIVEYRALTRQCGVEGVVTFDDRYVPDEDVPDLFEACDWVALPYSRTFTSQSGVLNVAAWYRRPVLASAAGTFAETLEEYDLGVMVAPDDARALVEGMGRIIERTERGDGFEFEAYLRENSWERNVRRTVEVYGQLCGRGER